MRFIQFIWFLFYTLKFSAQQPYSINYTTENGLPSNEVYFVNQDKKGYMWFGTDQGVSRFDGYQFKNYGFEDGLTRLEINQVIEDEKGKLWFSSYFGEIFSFENEKFKPYKFNNLVKEFYNLSKLTDLTHIDEEENFYISSRNKGILKIDKNGITEKVNINQNGLGYFIEKQKYFIISNTQQHNKINQVEFANLLYLFNGNYQKIELPIKTNYSNIPFKANLQIVSTFLFAIEKNIVSVSENKVLKIYDASKIDPNNIKLIDGDLYLIGKGIEIHKDWINKGYSADPFKWMPNETSNFVFKDKQNGLWISTLTSGVYYMPNANSIIWQSPLKENYFTSIEGLNQSIAAGTYGGEVYLIENGKINYSFKSKSVVKEIVHDKINEELLVLPFGKFSIKSKKLSEINNLFGFYMKQKKATFPNLYFANLSHLGITAKGNNSLLLDTTIYKKHENPRIQEFYIDTDNIVWLATAEGLYTVKDKKLIKNSSNSILQNIRINTIDKLSSGEMVFGSKGRGVVIGTDENAVIINTKNGLSSNLVNHIWVDKSDNIWATTFSGLNKITKKNNSYKVVQYHKAHGLPSEEIIKLIDHNNQIWIATKNGLVNFIEPKKQETNNSPLLTYLELNNRKYSKLENFNYDQNNLILRFNNFDYNLGNKVFYRYQLNNGPWQIQQGNEIRFNNLKSGIYNLEVQSQNRDQEWSKSYKEKFEIKQILWKKAWFLGLCLFSIALGIYYWYKQQISNIKAKVAINIRIAELEKKAALAQFNPHFIFNATSTIQYYIATNELKQAENYLTNFTYVLRKIMDNSSRNSCLLSEEIELIKKYINLERIRFGHKFSFELNIDKLVDPICTKVPPMLFFAICDYVINSRLMHRRGKDGKFIMHIDSTIDSLLIKVLDNGLKVTNDIDLPSSHNSLASRIEFYKINKYFEIDFKSQDLEKDNDLWFLQIINIKEKTVY